MNEPNPDAQLCATREAVEKWLTLHGEFWDGDQNLTANNLTLWAISFLRITKDEAQAAEDRLKREGARAAFTRIQDVAERAAARAPEIDYDHLLATSFQMEMTRMNEQG
ncbi:hypothetical protein CCAX7_15290 [Capsulimonas corticalis]|uniref:Uncharacterized protein n=1 Tax=Capsulimonas corticalis TaxID=2219043 RepID=A0A402CZB5_9BACT|nr:hypothetical protein [Capsulimonas corticalis]BDI29478.1 hypothetical protein CCAX7_15290 [Capsulimonas corticalis]